MPLIDFVILGCSKFSMDDGKENRNYYNGLYTGYIGYLEPWGLLRH